MDLLFFVFDLFQKIMKANYFPGEAQIANPFPLLQNCFQIEKWKESTFLNILLWEWGVGMGFTDSVSGFAYKRSGNEI